MAYSQQFNAPSFNHAHQSFVNHLPPDSIIEKQDPSSRVKLVPNDFEKMQSYLHVLNNYSTKPETVRSTLALRNTQKEMGLKSDQEPFKVKVILAAVLFRPNTHVKSSYASDYLRSSNKSLNQTNPNQETMNQQQLIEEQNNIYCFQLSRGNHKTKSADFTIVGNYNCEDSPCDQKSDQNDQIDVLGLKKEEKKEKFPWYPSGFHQKTIATGRASPTKVNYINPFQPVSPSKTKL